MKFKLFLVCCIILNVIFCIWMYNISIKKEQKQFNITITETPSLFPTITSIIEPTPTEIIKELNTVIIECPNDTFMMEIIDNILEEKVDEKILEPIPTNPYTELIENLTDYEKELICRITVRECIDEPIEGQRAVIEIIFNRILSSEWPNTVEKVLSQKGQFATWAIRDLVTEKQIKQIEEVLEIVKNDNELMLPDLDYVFFSTKRQKYAKNYITIKRKNTNTTGHNFGTSLDSSFVLTKEHIKDFYTLTEQDKIKLGLTD